MSKYEANYVLDFRPMMLGNEAKNQQYITNRTRREKHQKQREDVVLFWRSFWLFGGIVCSLGFIPVLVDLICNL